MREKRKARRRHLFEYFKIFDQETGSLFGELADITTGGIMLVSDKPVEKNAVHRLRVELPEQMRHRRIHFSAECVRCRKDDYSGLFESGFRFVDIAPEDIEIIRATIL
jgi:c-di-GMP-binding flagellar brake protein YcgR